ncbi:MAG: glycosyltransferase, partial [Deltaproteobacteria bacterium]|nr:glycosyltransferase [Deltaproteobacteria bacterium]
MRMKIAIVTPFIASCADVRYYASQHLHIANELVGQGASVDIYTLNRESNEYRENRFRLEKGEINIYGFPFFLPAISSRLGSPNMAPMRGLGESLKARDYDIIQVSEDLHPSSFQAALCNGGSRFVIFQGINSYSQRPGKRAVMRLVDGVLGRMLRRRTDLVIAKTTEAESFMRAKGYRDAVTIPMGVNTAHFRPRNRDEAKNFLAGKGVREHDLIAVYVGNLITRRDIAA